MTRAEPNPPGQTEKVDGSESDTSPTYKKKLKKELDRVFDERIEALALERIKTWDASKAISLVELKERLGISD
jgi:hypothetical protein